MGIITEVTRERGKAVKTPGQRSMEYLKKQGYTCARVERWNSFAKVRQDLFGGIDIVAIKPGTAGVLGIQATTAQNISVRKTKLLSIPTMKLWLECGNRLVVIGWKRDTNRWIASEVEVQLSEFPSLPESE